MAGKLGQLRKGSTFYTQTTQSKSRLISPSLLHVTDVDSDRDYTSNGGSRGGSISPTARPTKVSIHYGGPQPKDEPKTSQYEDEKYK